MKTLNLDEAAAFLHMHPYTLMQKVHAGEIPAAKPGKRWVFVDDDLLACLRGQYRTPAAVSLPDRAITEPSSKTPNSKKAYLHALGLA